MIRDKMMNDDLANEANCPKRVLKLDTTAWDKGIHLKLR